MGDEQYWRTFEENARAMVESSAPLDWRLTEFGVWRDGADATVRSVWAWGDPGDEHGVTVESSSPREGDALDVVIEQLRRWDPLA